MENGVRSDNALEFGNQLVVGIHDGSHLRTRKYRNRLGIPQLMSRTMPYSGHDDAT